MQCGRSRAETPQNHNSKEPKPSQRPVNARARREKTPKEKYSQTGQDHSGTLCPLVVVVVLLFCSPPCFLVLTLLVLVLPCSHPSIDVRLFCLLVVVGWLSSEMITLKKKNCRKTNKKQ
ncbi:MAG: hypothetical protein J3R72DRAFT_256608 [Linnemannia gamsii]|nr:MAG: hypothetical protein J3R72DRAFT_256608 [Linnemannia gamsii]